MTVALFTHSDMLDHQPGAGHAERPERLRAVIDALQDDANLDLELNEAPLVEPADLKRIHPRQYVDEIFAAAPSTGQRALDPDTILSPGSLNAARRAAGAVVAAVREVAAGKIDRAFCAVRPPGHHAEPDTAMGFCVFSNVAVAARAAQAAGLARVAVVDFDVHHGNGAQAAFEHDPSLFLASIHQSPLYPGTGDPSERGLGNIANATVPPHAPRELWRQRFEGLMDQLDAFAPDLIIVSAGFDAHARDPLASQSLEEADFAWATRAIASVAASRSRGRIVSSLEGGYDLEALGRSALAHVRALQEG
ncbi:histone deacetylase family protein [Caulobacter sp. NIBR2454]|uniref:histone deacetylase family protein n=1 Tax=Caulobacter sp. NIBR2454 TaxID=3015996 RepID=UPI0022B6F767|nr:histone deacetylase family protein [Caulobacter sp. NIBR2454]